MRHHQWLSAAIIMGLSSWACVACASLMQSDSMPLYTRAQTITVSPQQPSFKIVQKANPSTGYSWAPAAYNAQLLTLMSAKYSAPNSAMAGASGQMTWIFQAKPQAFQQPAATRIQLTYQRPWAPKDHPSVVTFPVRFQNH